MIGELQSLHGGRREADRSRKKADVLLLYQHHHPRTNATNVIIFLTSVHIITSQPDLFTLLSSLIILASYRSMMEPPANKRSRGNDGTIVAYHSTNENDEPTSTEPRTSSLPAPTLQLTGHKGSVYACSYSPSGQTLCSASFDMTCLLWSHGDNYMNFNVLKKHKNAVLDCCWCDDDTVLTCSADKVR